MNDIPLSDIRKMVFQAPPGDHPIPTIGNDELIELKNENRTVKGLLSKAGRFLVVIFHGNASTMNREITPASHFYSNNVSTLLVEYPGYGLSSQFEASENNIYSDSESIVKYVQKKYGYDHKNTFLYGRSLGSGVAVEMARRKLGSKLVLITPFTSMPAVGQSLYPDVFSQHPELIDMPDKFDNITKSKDIELPVFMVHGDKDPTVPYEMAVALSKSFVNARLITLKSAKHGDIYEDMDETTWKRMDDFLTGC